MSWQPIETAPKDGRDLLLWDVGLNKAVFGAFRVDLNYCDRPPLWLQDDWNDYACGYGSTPLEPSHWQPLPDPPA